MNPSATPLEHETAILLARHEREPEHTRQVARLALQLFDGLRPLHGYGAAERRLLECAALLHDTGWSVTGPSGHGHHKASARLIREFPWTALTPDEVRCVAATARYHRKALPDPGHDDLLGLSEANQARVRWMAACLRTADGWDRRHLGAVDRITVVRSGDRVELRAEASGRIDEEWSAADRKSDLLRSLLPGPLTLSVIRPGHRTPEP